MAEGATAPGPPGTADAFTEEFARLLAENDRFAEVYDRTRLTAAPLTGCGPFLRPSMAAPAVGSL